MSIFSLKLLKKRGSLSIIGQNMGVPGCYYPIFVISLYFLRGLNVTHPWHWSNSNLVLLDLILYVLLIHWRGLPGILRCFLFCCLAKIAKKWRFPGPPIGTKINTLSIIISTNTSCVFQKKKHTQKKLQNLTLIYHNIKSN